MYRLRKNRASIENPDAVGLVFALLVTFPEIASIEARSADGTIRLTFVVKAKLDRKHIKGLTVATFEHVHTYLSLSGEEPSALHLECDVDGAMTFLHLIRDGESFSRDELVMVTRLFADVFGDTLVRHPAPDEAGDVDPVEQDELVDSAIEALRDPSGGKNLVGFREEKHVLVYQLKSRKKKARR
jgi:hypothetical protein